MSISDLLPPESLHEGLAHFRMLAECGTAKADLAFRHKNGSNRFWAIESVKLSDTRFLGFAKDITIRAELEEELRNHKIELEMQNIALTQSLEKTLIVSEKFSRLYDFAPSCYFTLSSEGEIQELNHSAARLLGQERAILKGNPLHQFVSKESRSVYDAFFRNINTSQITQRCELILEIGGFQQKNVHVEGVISGEDDHCLLSVVDITDRIQTEYELKQTSTRLALAARAGGVGVWDLDLDDNHLIWDDQMFSLYGIEKNDFSRAYESWLSGVHPEDRSRGDSEIRMAIRNEKEFDTEFRVCWPDGSVHNIRAMAVVQYDETGNPIHLIGTNWDITSQKKLEENLKSSETNFRNFFETMNDMIIVGNTQGEIIYANNSLYKTLGYSSEDLNNMHVLDLNPAESRAEAEQIFSDMFAGKLDSCPLPLMKKDGVLISAETHVWFGKWDGKDCIFGLAKDLSAVQEALQKFNKIFNNNPTLMAISTLPEGIFTDVNQTFLNKTEYSREEIIGKTTTDLGLFLQPEKQRAASIELAATGILHNFELQIKTKSGKILDGLFSGEIIESQGTKYFLTVMSDISQRKKAEKALMESEALFHSLFEQAPVGAALVSLDYRFLMVNEALCHLSGFSAEELLSRSFAEIVPPDENPDELTRLQQNEHFSADRYETDKSYIRKDGSLVMMHVNVRLIRDLDGNPQHLLSMMEDITERRHAEEALRISESRFHAIFEESPVSIWEEDFSAVKTRFDELRQAGVTDFRSYFEQNPEEIKNLVHRVRILEVNQQSVRLLGAENAEEILHEFAHFFSEESLNVFREEMTVLAEGKTRFQAEFSTLNLKGEQINLDLLLAVQPGSEQNLSKILVSLLDITKRKKAEIVMRESEANLAEAQRIAHMGSWDWDMNTGVVKWSKEMFHVFDIDPESYDGRPETVLGMLHPDDHEHFNNFMFSNLTTGNVPSREYRVIHRDGSLHTIFAEGKTEFGPDNKPCKSVGTVQDITERKKAEEELRQSKSFLDSIIENIPHMIFIKDAQELRFVRLNQAAENLLGIPIEEMVGKNDYDFFRKNFADNFIHADRLVLDNRVMVDIPEEPIATKYNGIRTLHTKKVPVMNAKGDPEYLLGISEDITEFKQAELEKKIQEEKYRTILSSSPDGVLLIDLKGIITEVSEIGLEIFGARNREGLIGKRIYRFVPSDERNTVREIIEKTMSEGLAQNIELRIRKLNRSVTLSEISSTLIQDSEGEPVSFMIILRDISQRKKTETKQIHADRMANLGEMASGIAHEINQPLNIISMVMDKILFESAKTEYVEREFLLNKSDKIFENITRIRNIIDHVRTFSRSHDDFVLTAFDINSSIENAASMIMEQFKHLGINLELHLDKQIPQMFGNTYKFEQVILNLLVNAKDAVIEKKNKQEGNPDMHIGIRTYQENQLLIAEIRDNGIGIGHDDINNIMLPFYTTKDEGKGTGLGLSICYQIITEMNGVIEIVSDKIQGTKIRLVMNTNKKSSK